MEIKKGDWRFDRVVYSASVLHFLTAEIENRRPFIVLPMEVERGARFNDDGAVIARIESNYTEEEFMACPRLYFVNMLFYAAKSDYWDNHVGNYEDNSIPNDNESA